MFLPLENSNPQYTQTNDESPIPVTYRFLETKGGEPNFRLDVRKEAPKKASFFYWGMQYQSPPEWIRQIVESHSCSNGQRAECRKSKSKRRHHE